MPDLPLILLLLAAVSFFVAIWNVPTRVNLLALGLFLYILALLLGG